MPDQVWETEDWPYVEAKHQGPRRTGTVRLIVIHTAEANEKIQGAEDLAKYGQNPDYVSSWHIAVDNDSIVQSVKDSRVAYAAPGANHDGIQIELIARANQSKLQWLDRFSIGSLALGADAVAQYCLKYNIPPIHLTNEQLAQGKRGIIGHYQASEVYKKSDHRDPGPHFPWNRFILMVAALIAERRHAS